MSISIDHLQRTLSHPLLSELFNNFCSSNESWKTALDLFLLIEELQSTFDDVWLSLQTEFILSNFLKDSTLNVPEDIILQIKTHLREKDLTTQSFSALQENIFTSLLSEALKQFLQSEMYHNQYDNLRKGSIFTRIREFSGLESFSKVYCSIAASSESITTPEINLQSRDWNVREPVHKLELVPHKEGSIHIHLFHLPQSCWQENQLIGTAVIKLENIWDEIPQEVWLPIQGEHAGNYKIKVGLVLIHRPSIGLTVGELDFTNPLATCCAYGHYWAVKKLIDNGISLDDRMEESNRTALHISVLKKRTKIVQLLLSHKADPNIVDSHSQTPLHIAAQFAPSLCHLLIAAGARVDTKELFQNGQTALHMLALNNYYLPLHYLILKGAEVNSQTLDGLTPLHKAISQESIECVELLLENKANIHLKDRNNISALTLAEKISEKSENGKKIFQMLKDKDIKW